MGLLGWAVAEDPLCFPAVLVESVVYVFGAKVGFGEEAFVVEEWLRGVGDEVCGWEVVSIHLGHVGDCLMGLSKWFEYVI